MNFLQLRKEMTGDDPSQGAIGKAPKIEGGGSWPALGISVLYHYLR